MALKFAASTKTAAPAGHVPAPVAPLTVSDRAAKRIGEILRNEKPGAMMRVSVEGGGCSGFQYKFAIEGETGMDDFRIDKNGITVLVDAVSAPFLAGSELDFVTELMGQSFQVKNPNATASCGCGTSFSL